ncbi:MAG: hypothetical protein EAZ85_06840 [Bacteroidetes bacterium]|nr:MAG: hypothetical protein EAZ85_06840 [Bacteroidota bacterium]TAG89536.1 MAG: hypothetical protein EAZ20_06245 [Bacteroidota bacterium]
MIACKKKQEAQPDNTAAVSQIITSRPWNGDTGSADIEVPSTILTLAQIDANSLKNLAVDVSRMSVTFNSNGTFTGKDLAGQNTSGQWQLLENGTKLKLIGANLAIPLSSIPANFQSLLTGVDLNLPDTYTIKELTDTKFVLYTETDRRIPVTLPGSSIPLQVDVKLKITINLKRI